MLYLFIPDADRGKLTLTKLFSLDLDSDHSYMCGIGPISVLLESQGHKNIKYFQLIAHKLGKT